MPGYILTREADADLDEQADYYAERESLELAARFLESAHRTCDLIADYPGMGRQCKFRQKALSGVRWVAIEGFKEHLVFYRQAARTVEILRVVHGRRNLVLLFSEPAAP